MAKESIFVQNDLRPAYYDDFHCLADGCQWNCCKGWHITFDKKDYLSLKHGGYSPELSEKMEHGLRRIRKKASPDTAYAEIRLQEDGVCPFQREDGLCDIQAEKGAQALPFVCTIFPRIEGYYWSGYFERSLSMACEGVVALLWDLPQGIDFRSDPLPKERLRSVEIEADSWLTPHFQEVRSLFIDYLQDRRFPLTRRILMIGLAVQELQTAKDYPHWLAFAHALPESPNIHELLKIDHSETILRMFLTNNLKVLINIRSEDKTSAELRAELLKTIGMRVSSDYLQMKINVDNYLTAHENYKKVFADRDVYFMENVMVALFFHLHLPVLSSPEKLWKSYVNFCSLYSLYRFITIFSCREGVTDQKAELFRLIVMVSRAMLHNNTQQATLRDELFANDSTTLAHMAVLLSG